MTATITKKTTYQGKTLEDFQNSLKTDPRWAERAILAIYSRQTASEKIQETTTENNGVGFTGYDGDILSSFAKWILSSKKPEGSRLTPGQLKVAHKRMPKYAKQLMEIALAKGTADLAAARAEQVAVNAVWADPAVSVEVELLQSEIEADVASLTKPQKTWTVVLDDGSEAEVDYDPALEIDD